MLNATAAMGAFHTGGGGGGVLLAQVVRLLSPLRLQELPLLFASPKQYVHHLYFDLYSSHFCNAWDQFTHTHTHSALSLSVILNE